MVAAAQTLHTAAYAPHSKSDNAQGTLTRASLILPNSENAWPDIRCIVQLRQVNCGRARHGTALKTHLAQAFVRQRAWQVCHKCSVLDLELL